MEDPVRHADHRFRSNVPINILQVILVRESFQSITCTGTDNLTRTTKRCKTTSQNNGPRKQHKTHSK